MTASPPVGPSGARSRATAAPCGRAARRVAAGPLRLVHLDGPRALIAGRMAARTGHFMPPSPLDSQFAALEPPGADEGALRIDIARPLDAIVADICAALRQNTP